MIKKILTPSIASILLLILPFTFTNTVISSAKPFMYLATLAIAVYFAGFLIYKNIFKIPKSDLVINIKPVHYVQMLMHLTLYSYSSYFHNFFPTHFSLIAFQAAYAFLLNILLGLSFKNKFELGFSVFPIVFSTNLFLAFKPEFFGLQIVLISFAVASKYIFIWGSPKKHIFNPSALAMAAAAILILIFHKLEMTDTLQIVQSYTHAPHFILVIFSVAMISTWFGEVPLISASCIALLILLNAVFLQQTGIIILARVIHESVFIGICLLVTDPATTPKSKSGQICFGFAYAILIILGSFVLTQLGHQFSVFDKILPVPLLNLLSPQFNKIKFLENFSFNQRLKRWVPTALFAGAFAFSYPFILDHQREPTLDGLLEIYREYPLWEVEENSVYSLPIEKKISIERLSTQIFGSTELVPLIRHLNGSELGLNAKEFTKNSVAILPVREKIVNLDKLDKWSQGEVAKERRIDFLRLYLVRQFCSDELRKNDCLVELGGWQASRTNCVREKLTHISTFCQNLISLCHKDIQQFCAQDEPRRKCLQNHIKELTANCAAKMN